MEELLWSTHIVYLPLNLQPHYHHPPFQKLTFREYNKNVLKVGRRTYEFFFLWQTKNMCVFDLTLDIIDSKIIDSDKIDYEIIDFDIIDLCLNTVM